MRSERRRYVDPAGQPGYARCKVNIRGKIVWVVLPLIITPLVLTGVASVLTARESVTSVAAGLLQFKAEQLGTYAQGQWDLLVANGLEADATYREASEAAVETFARSLLRSSTELVVALAGDGSIALRTGDVPQDEPGRAPLVSLAAAGASGWQTLSLAGVERVAYVNRFTPFGWTVFVTEASATFYRSTERIVLQTVIILGASLLLALLLLLVFADRLTRPLGQMTEAMQDIITTGDMSERVETLYRDETGRLGHTFNLMIADLERVYSMVKGYALRAAVAKENEEKIRKIFQVYVPASVIDDYYASPEQMLVGKQGPVALLFSDIRNFTRFVEKTEARLLVEILNDYFGRMAKPIYDGHGRVDKTMGDGIMAVFGAPETQENDSLEACRAALGMLDAIPGFNEAHEGQLKEPFRMGIGIHYGRVTVGNIGSEYKMDYTLVGDPVNIASRIEGLTKRYHEPLLVSHSIQSRLRGQFPCRLLDRVSVKGREGDTGIYVLRRSLDPVEAEAWNLHNDSTTLYYGRKYREAAAGFRRVVEMLPKDMHARRFLAECEKLGRSPPGPEWTGVVPMTEK